MCVHADNNVAAGGGDAQIQCGGNKLCRVVDQLCRKLTMLLDEAADQLPRTVRRHAIDHNDFVVLRVILIRQLFQ